MTPIVEIMNAIQYSTSDEAKTIVQDAHKECIMCAEAMEWNDESYEDARIRYNLGRAIIAAVRECCGVSIVHEWINEIDEAR